MQFACELQICKLQNQNAIRMRIANLRIASSKMQLVRIARFARIAVFKSSLITISLKIFPSCELQIQNAIRMRIANLRIANSKMQLVRIARIAVFKSNLISRSLKIFPNCELPFQNAIRVRIANLQIAKSKCNSHANRKFANCKFKNAIGSSNV